MYLIHMKVNEEYKSVPQLSQSKLLAEVVCQFLLDLFRKMHTAALPGHIV